MKEMHLADELLTCAVPPSRQQAAQSGLPPRHLSHPQPECHSRLHSVDVTVSRYPVTCAIYCNSSTVCGHSA